MAIAERARPGVVGVAVQELGSGRTWFLNGDRPFPMQSVFKAPLGAAVLQATLDGGLTLQQSVTLTAADLSPSYSAVADAFPERTSYTIEELLVRAVGASDNTAADVLMQKVGGPSAVTGFLEAHGIEGLRVDRYERQLQPQMSGLDGFLPEWVSEEKFSAAIAAVPEPKQREALAEYLGDPRDTSTPRAGLGFLVKLVSGALLPAAPTEQLLRIMTESTTGKARLKAGIPAAASLAHKTGTSRTVFGISAAANDIGIVTLPDGRRLAIAVFLSGAQASEAERDAILAAVARAACAQ